MTADATGLLYLRARYYSSYLNQFQSRDSFPGYGTLPQSQNGFSYANNNPINAVDPTGRDPFNEGDENPRDLTVWLYNEMMFNLNDPRLQDVRAANRAGDLGTLIGSGVFAAGCYTLNPLVALFGGVIDLGSAGIYASAAVQYGQLVGDHKPWDFKHKINEFLGPGVALCGEPVCKPDELDVEYSVPGNIHFGFITREAGYASVVVNIGAGYAEFTDPSHHDTDHPNYEAYDLAGKFDPVIGPAGLSLRSLNFGDDPEDHYAVQFGTYLYDTYGRGLSLTTFRRELSRFLPDFSERTPDLWPVPAYIANDWPYPVGYFNPDP